MLFYLSLLSISGCDALQSKINEIENLANEFVAIGFYLGVEEIDTPLIDDATLALLDDLTSVELFLATAASSQDLNSNPVSRADVTLNSPLNGVLPVEENNPGQYSTNTSTGLLYDESEVALFEIEHTGIDHAISVNVPAEPSFTLNASHNQNEDLDISFSNQAYENALAFVVNVQTGEVTYDNRPTTPMEMYELTHPQGILLNEVEPDTDSINIPGSAFGTDGIYVIGVAGIISSKASQMNNINTAISGLIAGKFNIEAICIPQCQ